MNVERPNSFAIVKVETVGDHGFFDNSKKRLYITHVDDENYLSLFARYPETVYLKEGVHKINILFKKNFYRSHACLWIDAKPRGKYTVRRKAFKKEGRNRMRFWIVSDATGKTVGGGCDSDTRINVRLY